MKIVSLINVNSWERVMTSVQEKRLQELGDFHGPALEGDDLKQAALDRIKAAGGADVLLGCWGTPKIDDDIVAACGDLKLYAYSAGSIKSTISKELLETGIRATTAAPAIGIGVAEYAMTQVYAFSKKLFYYRVKSRDEWKGGKRDDLGQNVFEIYSHSIGVVGAGFVGRNMIRLLHEYDVTILCYDPFLTDEKAAELGVTKVDDLKELASQSMVLTLHAPNIESTHHMINADVLKAMPDGALLVNTARGALIDEEALIAECRSGRIYACLDVTDPEPPVEDSELYSLENIFLSPHIAGCVSENFKRQSEVMVDEVAALVGGKDLIYEVTVEKYDISA